jgi:hypothetical protein
MDVAVTAAALVGGASFLVSEAVWPYAVLAGTAVATAWWPDVVQLAALPLYIALAALGEQTPIGVTSAFAALCFAGVPPVLAQR